MVDTKTFKVTASPHTISKESTRGIMIDVLIALLPSFIAGIVFFGLNAIYTVIVCMILCYACEQIYNLCIKKPLTTDLSCLVTGMILGLILPPKTPWYIPIVGAIFAIVFIKMLFGGIGKNISNPAATARVFLLLAFSIPMGNFLIPKANDFVHIDGLTGPTYLGGGYATLEGSFMGVSGYWGYILQLFFGHVGGSIGETSALAILIGFAYLMIRKVIDWRIPVSYVVSSALMTLICYQSASDVLPQLLSGGLLFGAVFMATDYATCPKFKHNRVLFGIFLGFMTILLRKFSSYPESVSFVIILANLFVPVVDRFILPLRFGQTDKKGKVRVDYYGISMQWIIPVFLVIIIILSAIFAVVNPYVNQPNAKIESFEYQNSIQKESVEYHSKKVQVSNNPTIDEKKFAEKQYDSMLSQQTMQSQFLLSSVHNDISMHLETDANIIVSIQKNGQQAQRIFFKNENTTSIKKSIMHIALLEKATQVQPSIERQVQTNLGGALCVKM